MYSGPSLHPRVLRTQAHQELFISRSSLIARERSRRQRALLNGAGASPSIRVPLTTVSTQNSFDAYVNISFPGAGGALSTPLLVDSGNNSLIFPDYTTIASFPGFSQNYEVLEYDIQEPWRCPACKLRGPIMLPLDGGGFHCIRDCVFYACTGPNENNERTANFGTGCLAQRQLGTTDIQSPLAVSKDYPFAEFNYAPAVQIFEPGVGPIIVGNSFLTLYTDIPADYQMLKIIEGQYWMSLRPLTLTVGGKKTMWPGDLAATSLALVDTGGGPVFLSDPENIVWTGDWPSPAVLPGWIGGSYCCQATSANIAITLADANNKEFSYNIDTTKLPPPVQGLTLVMCKQCSYMGTQENGMSQNGMNIGGVSALFNYILIDYASARVGFKGKSSELV
jgi:hypothetical protein